MARGDDNLIVNGEWLIVKAVLIIQCVNRWLDIVSNTCKKKTKVRLISPF